MIRRFVGFLGVLLSVAPAAAQDVATEEDLAKQLSNPIAAMISVPFQLNYDRGIGRFDTGEKYALNFQPVVPFSIGSDWNVISRTIIPLVNQHEIVPGSSASGVGDTLQSFFFSPKEPTAGGLIWGVGPVFLLPTASKPTLGEDQFAAGVTAIALTQKGPWTFGGLVNHLWSVDRDLDQPRINRSFLQPFVSYTTPDAWTFTLNSEALFDWEIRDRSVPVNAIVTKLVKIGGRPVSIGGGVRYYAHEIENGADRWGARLQVTLLYPK